MHRDISIVDGRRGPHHRLSFFVSRAPLEMQGEHDNRVIYITQRAEPSVVCTFLQSCQGFRRATARRMPLSRVAATIVVARSATGIGGLLG